MVQVPEILQEGLIRHPARIGKKTHRRCKRNESEYPEPRRDAKRERSQITIHNSAGNGGHGDFAACNYSESLKVSPSFLSITPTSYTATDPKCTQRDFRSGEAMMRNPNRWFGLSPKKQMRWSVRIEADFIANFQPAT